MSRQYWARGIWGLAVAVASTAAAIAATPQNAPQQNPNQNQAIQNQGQNQGAQQGQQTQQDGRNIARQEMNRGMGANGFGANQEANLDHLFVKVLIRANKDEIEMGKLAEQRSINPAVKQLATQMVEDHTKFNEQLERFKGAAPAQREVRAGQPAQRSTGFRGNASDQTPQPQQETQQLQQQQQGTPQQRLPDFQQQLQNRQNGQQNGQNNQNAQNGQQPAANANRNEMADQGRHDHMMMHGTAGRFAMIMEQVDRNMQQSLVRDLSSKEGPQFDRCYLSAQLFGHMWVVDALKVFEQNASPQLKPILQEGLQTSQQHLEHIKSALAKMENAPQGNAAVQHRVGRVVR
jgi:predicted outer membrane protein